MDGMGRVMEGPAFVRYTPTAGDGDTRIIKMVNAPIDPLEPPKFGHKKIPRGPPSPPPPVLHSPPRKVRARWWLSNNDAIGHCTGTKGLDDSTVY
jgi:hypothetical protein